MLPNGLAASALAGVLLLLLPPNGLAPPSDEVDVLDALAARAAASFASSDLTGETTLTSTAPNGLAASVEGGDVGDVTPPNGLAASAPVGLAAVAGVAAGVVVGVAVAAAVADEVADGVETVRTRGDAFFPPALIRSTAVFLVALAPRSNRT